MNFLENIFVRLNQAQDRVVLREARDARLSGATGGELLDRIATARALLKEAGLRRDDRCALLAHNSIGWVALDLALMAEGIIAVPLYTRQSTTELVAMMEDCSPRLLCCGDVALRDAVTRAWPTAPPQVLLDEIFPAGGARQSETRASRSWPQPVALADADPVTIIYTSGTSGEAKGAILTAGNITHMLGCTTAWGDLLMGRQGEPDRVFHYLPFCFAASWIMLLSCLSRASVLTLSSDLTRLAEEIRQAEPHYFQNVPTVLERIRAGVQENLRQRGGIAAAVFEKGQAAWLRRQNGQALGWDALWLALANAMVFPAIRKQLGPRLRVLICGSAPLAKETQMFFLMLGVRVLQGYGLTETTGICTMDHPQRAEPGRVGLAIPGTEMKLGEGNEILVRGPHIFPGYWNRPEETAQALRDGWFRTGDQGEVNGDGNWRIIGRLKNLIILNSGHNIAPEPLEESLQRSLPGAQQVVLVGNGRSYLAAIVTGQVAAEQVETALETLNQELPHYKRIRDFHIEPQAFSVENGLLTANGKLKRDAIAARFQPQIEGMYGRAVVA